MKMQAHAAETPALLSWDLAVCLHGDSCYLVQILGRVCSWLPVLYSANEPEVYFPVETAL